MAKFCGKCGALVENGVCPKCGAEYQGTAPFVLYKCREKAIYYIRGMFNIEIFKYIQYQHAFGAWNIAISICEIYASYDIKSKASMFVSKWEKSLVIILIVCILNLLIGNYIGFVLNLHMLYIRHIINKNKMLLISI